MHEGIVDAVQLVACVHLRDRAGPGAGLRRLRIVTLAGAELEIVEPNEPRLGAEIDRRLERTIKQIVGAREARVGHVHYGRRDASETQRPRRTFGLARERMRLVRRFGPPRRRRDVDEHAAALDLDRECRHAILFESWFADAGAAIELPTVPRTSDVVAVETAFAERPTDVVADIRHRAEPSILERDRKGDSSRLATLQRRARELLGAADVDPVLSTYHGVPPMLAFVLKCGAKLLVFSRKRLSRTFVDTTALRWWSFKFAGGISTTRDKVTGEIAQTDDLLASAAN